MLHLSKRAALILGITSILSPNGLNFCDASAMEMPKREGQRTFDHKVVGDTFINRQSNEFLIFIVADGNKYSTYNTDQGVRLTIQEVPGTGRCGDYAFGIDREELLKKIKTAIKENNADVNKYYKNYIAEYDGKYKNMSQEQLFESILSDDVFLDDDMLFLAGKLLKINVEIYTPDTASRGQKIDIKNAYGQVNSFTRINKLLLSRYSNDFPSKPVIRIYHGGHEYDGFKRSNTQHFRYLYNAENMEPWEKEKVRLLEEASAGYYNYSTAERKGERTYEIPAKEMFRIQAEVLGWAKNTGIQASQKDIPSKGLQIEIAAATLEKQVNAGADIEDMKKHLDNEGFSKSIWDQAIQLAKAKFGSSKKTTSMPSKESLEEEQIENATQKLSKYVENEADDEAMRNALYNEGIPGKLWNKAIEKAKSKFKPSKKITVIPNNKSVKERVEALGMTMDEFRQNRQPGMTDEELLDFLGG